MCFFPHSSFKFLISREKRIQAKHAIEISIYLERIGEYQNVKILRTLEKQVLEIGYLGLSNLRKQVFELIVNLLYKY